MSRAAFEPGALVRARGREWVVLPESSTQILMLRPLGGLQEESVGILPEIEPVQSTSFSPPDPSQLGDHNACRLLRDAARLSTRAAVGPFRSFGRIAVDPRPYQLVPLLLSLRQEVVRLLIADDVGIGKTIEAALIARELWDRGEVRRFVVLCPPHLAEQWQKELSSKFHLEAELVLSSTIARLERPLRVGESVFERHPILIVSTDFIKQAKYRDDFVSHAPKLVIVDEAHTCTVADRAGVARQQRFELLRRLADDRTRHLVLVTATPHSGNEAAFRSLLSLLDGKFADLPSDLDRDERAEIRKELAKHLVQRRRADVLDYLKVDTQFPKRVEQDATYSVAPAYRSLFEKVLAFAGELVRDQSGTKVQRRVRWWSALSLLRALASSPAAAAATLRNRAAAAEASTDVEADEIGRRAVMDEDESDVAQAVDLTPGGDAAEETRSAESVRARLQAYAREAERLGVDGDAKLQELTKIVQKLVVEGHNPIIFCRFLHTADYVAQHLRAALKHPAADVMAITGLMPPKEREDRIRELGANERRVLVCTDCLSEGINLHYWFDAVVHYDLSWNPTRHEQREGRVDRFGQEKPLVKVITYFGRDNKIDGIVLDVLINKHKKIKSDLGVSVTVPGNTEQVVEALFEGMLLRAGGGADSGQLFFDDWLKPQREALHRDWDAARDREVRSRSRFAQHSIKPDEVALELAAVRDAIGSGVTVRRFMLDVMHLTSIPAREHHRVIEVQLGSDAPRSLRNAVGRDTPFVGRFDLPVEKGQAHLSRTHPIVEGLASWVLETALDPVESAGQRVVARRCGVMMTLAVAEKTSLLLLRLRHHLITRVLQQPEQVLLAEELWPVAFRGTLAQPLWLEPSEIEPLLIAAPAGNVAPSMATQQLQLLVSKLPSLAPDLERIAVARAEAVFEAHTRVRAATGGRGRMRVQAVLPADVLGCFILMPSTRS